MDFSKVGATNFADNDILWRTLRKYADYFAEMQFDKAKELLEAERTNFNMILQPLRNLQPLFASLVQLTAYASRIRLFLFFFLVIQISLFTERKPHKGRLLERVSKIRSFRRFATNVA